MERCTVCLLALVLTTTTAFTQSPSTTDSPKTQFGVVVTDDHGAPIRDLTTKDFKIEVGGKTEPEPLKAVPPPAANATTTAASTSPNDAANGRGLILVVLDDLHTRWLEEKDLRPVIAKYLGTLASQNSPVSFLLLDKDGALHPIHEYTTSSATLTAALDRADAIIHKRTPNGDASPEVTAETERLVDFLKGTISNNVTASVPIRTSPEAIFETWRRLSEASVVVPGRKSLVWITGMLPFAMEEKIGMIASPSGSNGGGFGGLQEHQDTITADELARLKPIWESTLETLLRDEVALVPVAARGSNETSLDVETLHTMRSLAILTAGREVHPVGDPFKLLADLADQNRGAYDLTEAIPADGCKLNWCEMKITVDRPGAHVLAPTGFFHSANALSSGPATLASNLESSGIPFTISWGTPATAGTKKRMGFVVTFSPQSGVPPAGSNKLNLEINVRALTPSGAVKQAVKFTAISDLPQASIDQIHQKGFALNNAIELPPGDYVVKFMVEDKVGKQTGTVSVPLKVS